MTATVPSTISLRGVRVHNLKGVDLDIPLGKLTVVVGVSGAGKSSLVFETLFAESQRRYLQSFSVATRPFFERYDPPDADWIGDLPPAVAVRAAISRGDGTVGSFTGVSECLGQLMSRDGLPVCPNCNQEVRPARTGDVVAAIQAMPVGSRLTLAFVDAPSDGEPFVDWTVRLREEGWVRVQAGETLLRLDEPHSVAPPSDCGYFVLVDRFEVGKTAPERVYESVETAYRRGDGRLVLLAGTIPNSDCVPFDRRWRCPRCDVAVAEPEPGLFVPSDGEQRFTDLALSVRWRGRSIADLEGQPLRALASWLNEDDPLTRRMRDQLDRLVRLDLGHLPSVRRLVDVATGEMTRLLLAQALESGLVQTLFLFDEPTAGLNADEATRVLPHLLELRDAGNTLVVIDHHLALLSAADHIIEIGPGAGDEGGRILYEGGLAGLRGVDDSATAEHLALEEPARSRTRRRPTASMQLSGVRLPPFDGFHVEIPLAVLCVVDGPSGAGKTRLVRDVLFPLAAHAKGKKVAVCEECGVLKESSKFDDVVLVTQEPLARTARSNPATYLKVFDDIREVFAETADARIRNFSSGAFSFNQPGGRCEACEGQGQLNIDMRFLPDVRTTCPECLGTRYRKELLQIKVRGLSIAEVLALTIREAFRFFRAQRSIEKRLKWLLDLGLEYLQLGQPLDTLSGGEIQRLRLAAHLASSRKPRCLFLLVEPARGLHPADIHLVLACFDQLLSMGHSLVVVESHPLVVAAADHVVTLGWTDRNVG